MLRIKLPNKYLVVSDIATGKSSESLKKALSYAVQCHGLEKAKKERARFMASVMVENIEIKIGWFNWSGTLLEN